VLGHLEMIEQGIRLKPDQSEGLTEVVGAGFNDAVRGTSDKERLSPPRSTTRGMIKEVHKT
jgi:hypothetical protein